MRQQRNTLACLLALLAFIGLFARWEVGSDIPIQANWTSITLDDILPTSVGEMAPIELGDPAKVAAVVVFLRNHGRGWEEYPPEGHFPAVAPTHQLSFHSNDGQVLTLELVCGGTALFWRSKSGALRRGLSVGERDELMRHFHQKWSDEKFELVSLD